MQETVRAGPAAPALLSAAESVTPGYGPVRAEADHGSLLRAAIVGQYVRMAQSLGPVAARTGGTAYPSSIDEGVTNLQRDVLQAFLEQMGGVKSAGPGIYFKLRA